MNKTSQIETVSSLQLEIELACPEDITPIWELYQTVWLSTYPNEEFEISKQDIWEYLRNYKGEFIECWQKAIAHPGQADDNRAVFVARDKGAVIGFISPKINKGERPHRLTSLYVAPEARGKGVGSQLVEQVLDWHGDNDIYLYVAPWLKNAQRLYERFGFSLIEGEPYTSSTAAQYLTLKWCDLGEAGGKLLSLGRYT